jgi:putative oxidoreductase
MTTVSAPRSAVGIRPTSPSSTSGTSPIRRIIALEAHAEAGLKDFLERWSIPMLRIALGGVFLVFGAIKFFPGMSPIAGLVESTWERLTFGMVSGQAAMILTAILEVTAGALLIAGGVFARVGLVVLAFTFVGILSPIVLLPGEVFSASGPTLTGQYIFKDAILIAAALVVASRVLRGPRAAN